MGSFFKTESFLCGRWVIRTIHLDLPIRRVCMRILAVYGMPAVSRRCRKPLLSIVTTLTMLFLSRQRFRVITSTFFDFLLLQWNFSFDTFLYMLGYRTKLSKIRYNTNFFRQIWKKEKEFFIYLVALNGVTIFTIILLFILFIVYYIYLLHPISVHWKLSMPRIECKYIKRKKR